MMLLSGFLVLAATSVRAGVYLFSMPIRLQAECRGLGVGVEEMKQLEEQAGLGYGGIGDLAGWRVGAKELVVGDGMGRSQTAQMIEIYGNMELAFPAEILSGTYGTASEKDVCVLTKELAWELFGSLEAAGEKVWISGGDKGGEEKRVLTVAGVIGQEGEYVMVSAEEGDLEQIAISFNERFWARERLKEILGN